MAPITPQNDMQQRIENQAATFAAKSKLNKSIVVAGAMLVAGGAYLAGCPQQGDQAAQYGKEVSTVQISATTVTVTASPTTATSPTE